MNLNKQYTIEKYFVLSCLYGLHYKKVQVYCLSSGQAYSSLSHHLSDFDLFLPAHPCAQGHQKVLAFQLFYTGFCCKAFCLVNVGESFCDSEFQILTVIVIYCSMGVHCTCYLKLLLAYSCFYNDHVPSLWIFYWSFSIDLKCLNYIVFSLGLGYVSAVLGLWHHRSPLEL